MKKHIALALSAALSLSVAGTALAANPFTDVPANHWAYDAVAELQKDAVISGYGDGTFRGDRTLTRYELAAIVAKIDLELGKDNPLVKKLQAEFSTELYNLGVRVDALEKNASSIKFSGNARLRYYAGSNTGYSVFDRQGKNSEGVYTRINLYLNAKVNDNIEFFGTLRAQNDNYFRAGGTSTARTSWTRDTWFHRAEFKYTKNKFSASFGRLNPSLGQGLIFDGEAMDGILANYDFGRVNLMAGYGDVSALYNSGGMPTLGVFIANMGVKVTDKINFSAAYLDAVNSQNSVGYFGLPGYGYEFKQWAVGANAKLGNDFKITAEYVKNSDAPEGKYDDAKWARLQWKAVDHQTPGTFDAYAEYLNVGGWAIDSYSWGHTLDVPAGNGLGGNGAKGWGVGFRYVPAKNVRTEITFHDLKPTRDAGLGDYKKSYMFTTHLYF